mmetsp:Transcript_7054/g.20003  ORF Transcript_7054/g.20003 Transcript_7054/m.20003 type:complete len:189 (-) Transcript_7054:247-813(-)|eukprot:CAMPEP_0119122784 /NCGR_PEP_ID=MMETSP1310-20130426/2942_1 /TAXON_ID=464262 /ORGANISM="Genus nov. species nov., Strain RCC2339" /LENGTH=188 /DNA_ID=CAMNT_0007112497 /DNA_START=92 /DNA_END=658 /DNA_ORIENTATION=-
MAEETINPLKTDYVVHEPTEICVKEKALSFTGDDASVLDKAGNTLFKVKASKMSMSQRREIVDKSGAVVAQLRFRRAGLHTALYIGTKDDEKVLTFKESDRLSPHKKNAKIFLGEKQVGKAEGNWRAKTFEVKYNGRDICSFKRKSKTAEGIFFGADAYYITVNPNVDQVLVACIAIALDELYHDKNA